MPGNAYEFLDGVRITVVVGHFGSGKTEFSVNLALYLREKYAPVALADLDVVDPYFRSRECAALLEEKDIRLISSAPNCHDADLPSMPPEVQVLTDNPEIWGVMDIGGDPSGARVLARYRRGLQKNDARLVCVINANRPLSDTAEKTVSYIRGIEAACGMKVDALVNNTHCCHLTDLQDVLSGAEMAVQVSELTGIPILCHAVPRRLAIEAGQYLSDVFPMDLYMKKPWE